MIANFVVRLLDAENTLIAWAKVQATPVPQERASCPFRCATGSTRFMAERDGTITQMTVEWTDLGIARQREIGWLTVRFGQELDFIWFEPVWMVSGTKDVPLPPVTERQSVRIGVPPAHMGAKDPRT